MPRLSELASQATGCRHVRTWQVEAAHDAHLTLRQVQLDAAPLVHLQQHARLLGCYHATTFKQDAQLLQECCIIFQRCSVSCATARLEQYLLLANDIC